MFITCKNIPEKNAFRLCMSNPHTTGPKQNTFQTGKPELHLNSKIQPMEGWPRWTLTGGRKNPQRTRQHGGFRPFWTRGTAVIDTFHFLFLSRASQRGLGQLSVIWGVGQSSLIKLCKRDLNIAGRNIHEQGWGFIIQLALTYLLSRLHLYLYALMQVMLGQSTLPACQICIDMFFFHSAAV